ncbi:DUF922 domain-containing protein [Salegentibacter sediminis]|uniref:DUF922 domain-containing protein n=1 Tax=Salegentibacter sediminis TaxID=1930251 RepID=UPI0009BC98C3|nr:DUF922 domain-containing protein [Salegentibacter sediminis]
MRQFFFILVLLFSAEISFSQEQEKIEWVEGEKLTWADFKGTPKQGVAYEANTNSGISFSWSYSTESGKPVLEYAVVTNFFPLLSWVKEAEEDEYLLGHEQLHFDISELHARKLRKAIDEYEPDRNIRRDLNTLYEKIEKDRVAMQNLFDAETKHSTNKEAEAGWRKFVKEVLSKLSAYRD